MYDVTLKYYFAKVLEHQRWTEPRLVNNFFLFNEELGP